jgi:hypothetical protein
MCLDGQPMSANARSNQSIRSARLVTLGIWAGGLCYDQPEVGFVPN